MGINANFFSKAGIMLNTFRATIMDAVIACDQYTKDQNALLLSARAKTPPITAKGCKKKNEEKLNF